MEPPEDTRLLDRNGKIWLEYCAGRTQEHLAAKYDISTGRVSQIIAQVRSSLPETKRAEEIQRSLDMLRELRAGAVEIYELAPAPVFVGKDGDVARDPDNGEVVRDYSGKLRALESAVKVDESIRKLLGLDEPKRLDIGGEAAEAAAAVRLAEEARARLAGDA